MEGVIDPQPQHIIYICKSQSSDIPIVEQGRIQLFRSGIAYVWNGWSIYLNTRTSGVCSSYKNKNDRENSKKGYESQIEGSYLGDKMQRTIGHIQSNDQPHSQVGVPE